MVDPMSLSPIEEPIKRLRRKRSESHSSSAITNDPSGLALLLDAPGAIASGVQGLGRGVSGLAGKIGLGGDSTEPGNAGGFEGASVSSGVGNAISALGNGLGKAVSTAGDGLGFVANGAGSALSGAGDALSSAGDVLASAADVAGAVLSTVGDVAGPVAEATGEILGGLGEILN